MRFKLENTNYVIKYINRIGNEDLKKRLQEAGKSGIKDEAWEYAKEHNEEFGNRLIIELHDVFWDKVWYAIKTT